MIDNSKFEMVNSKYAMTTICNVLMNLTVLEPDFVKASPIFFHILKFIMNSLPTLSLEASPVAEDPDKGMFPSLIIFWSPYKYLHFTEEDSIDQDPATNLLVLYGNLSVLGLLILKHHSRRPKETDISLCKFVQAVVR